MTRGSSRAKRLPPRERHLLRKSENSPAPSAFASEAIAAVASFELSVGGEVSAVEAAYRHIKQRIIELAYPPGMKLSEVRLAREIGLGRSPLRSALARLKGEGWIAVSPQSGTYVKPPSSTN